MTTDRKTESRGLLQAGGVLDRIIAAKLMRLEQSKSVVPLEEMIEQSRATHRSTNKKSFAESLSNRSRINIIAEIKRRSPSKGIIREDYDVAAIARSYESGGAAAISVLGEEDFFGGSLEDVKRARNETVLPLLRKDFIFDEYQLYEAAHAGADAVLLIAAVLDDEMLARLISVAEEIGIETLVEAHTRNELERAARAGAKVVGVNNRDLTTFKVDLKTSIELAEAAPQDLIMVSESGINDAQDIHQLRRAGYKAFLIGEHFMRAENPGERLKALIEESSNLQ